MTWIDRIAVGFLVLMSLVLSFLSSLAIRLALESDTATKRDVTTVEIDVQSLARIKSIEDRLDTIEREKIEMGFSQTTLSGIISTRVYFLEQRIAELENANASGEGNRDDSPSGE